MGADTAALLLRVVIGVVMVLHGANHLKTLEGTTKWFASIGLKPPRVHALMSGVTEVGAGAALMAGLLTSLECAAVVGVMTVAFVTVHRKNGFFIFRPGEGYEYVVTLAVAAVALGALGPGKYSLDRALGIDGDLDGGVGLALSAGLGIVGAAALLAACWRPVAKP